MDRPDRHIALVHPDSYYPGGTFVDQDAPLPVSVLGLSGALAGVLEDSPHISGQAGLLIFGVRNDIPGSLVDTDLDYTPLQFNAAGELRVTTAAGGGIGATSQPDKSSFTEGSSLFNPIGGVYNESPVSDPMEDQAAIARITAKRALHVNLRTAAGAELSVDAQNRLRITGPVPDDGVSFNTAAPITFGGEDSNGFARVSRMGDAVALPDFRTVAVATYVHNPNNPSSTAWVRRVAFQGTHGNAWNGVSTGVNGLSNIIDCEHQAFVSIAGNSDIASNITLLVSQNGINFYQRDFFGVSPGVDFAFDYLLGFRYVRLRSSANALITATIASKTG